MTMSVNFVGDMVRAICHTSGHSESDLMKHLGYVSSSPPIAAPRPSVDFIHETKLAPEINKKPSTKRKYIKKPTPVESASSLMVGDERQSSDGSWHRVETRGSFKGTRQAWKCFDRRNDVATVLDFNVIASTEPLVDYDSSDDESGCGNCYHCVTGGCSGLSGCSTPVVVVESEDMTSSNLTPPSSPKTKRAYNSTKPTQHPMDAGKGCKTESMGKWWVVSEVPTRGDGKRLLWKLSTEDTKDTEASISNDETLAANIMMSLSGVVEERKVSIWDQAKSNVEDNIYWQCDKCLVENDSTSKKCDACESSLGNVTGVNFDVSPKKVRPGPVEPAKNVNKGDIKTGTDSRLYICVTRTRKAKDGGEDNIYNVWQKMSLESSKSCEFYLSNTTPF